LLLGALAKLRKLAVSSCLSGCLVRVEQLGAHWTDVLEI
jgi:hypothetical protein